MIDVEQRALRALEQHPLAARAARGAPAARYRPRAAGAAARAARAARRAASSDARSVLPISSSSRLARSHPVGEQRAGAVEPAEIRHPDAAPAVLVLVGRADAAAGRADLLALLARGIEQLVVAEAPGERGRRRRCGRSCRCPRLASSSSSPKKVSGSSTTPLPTMQVTPRVQDARRNLAQDEVRVADDDGMAGVRAALVAHDQVGPLGEDVDELALALVPPLRPDDHHAGGLRVEHVGSPACPTKRAPHGAPESSGKPMRGPSQQSIRRERPSHPYRGLEREVRRPCPVACGSSGACAT